MQLGIVALIQILLMLRIKLFGVDPIKLENYLAKNCILKNLCVTKNKKNYKGIDLCPCFWEFCRIIEIKKFLKI